MKKILLPFLLLPLAACGFPAHIVTDHVVREGSNAEIQHEAPAVEDHKNDEPDQTDDHNGDDQTSDDHNGDDSRSSDSNGDNSDDDDRKGRH